MPHCLPERDQLQNHMQSPLRILIISYDWPPRNAIAVHRAYAWARYWSEAGAKVSVLTAQKQIFDEPLDLRLNTLSGVDVVEVPYSPLGGFAGKATQTGWSQRLFSFLKKYGSTIKKLTGINADIRDAWAAPAVRAANEIIEAKRIDLIVSTFGPRSAHLIAAQIKKRKPEITWVADYRDLWSINHTTDFTPIQKRKEQALELRTVANADLFLTVSEPLAKDLCSFVGHQVHVSKNGFDIDLTDLDARLLSGKPKSENKISLSIVYTGTIYPAWQDPSPLFQAINELMAHGKSLDSSVRVHFYGKRQPTLQDLIDRHNAAGYAVVHGHVARPDALQAQMDADLLLLLESNAPSANGVLTGKIFEYIASGTPILSVGSPRDSAIGRLLSETGAGVACGNDIDKIKSVIMEALQGDTSKIYAPVPDAIKKYSRKVQALELLDLMERTVDSHVR